jgi:hypothetical protein
MSYFKSTWIEATKESKPEPDAVMLYFLLFKNEIYSMKDKKVFI